MFSFGSLIKNPAQMLPCTPELLNAALDDPKVADTCREIASRLVEVKNTCYAPVLAEGEGFKPPIPERGIPDFESSAIDHSANLPEMRLQR